MAELDRIAWPDVIRIGGRVHRNRQGDKAFFEHSISGIMQGEKAEYLAMCAYEFSDDKINKVRTVFDRLSIAEQASSKWIEKKFVNTIINQMQKGL